MALRYLRARRQEGFISVIALFSFLGIGLGVATLIIVMSVMNGFRAELLDRILGMNGHYEIKAPQNQPLTDYNPVIDSISKVDGVVRVTPLIQGQVMAAEGSNASGAIVRGMASEELSHLTVLSQNIVEGNLDGFDDGRGVLVGYRLAQSLGLRSGDRIKLISPKTTSTVVGSVPRVKTYKIAGLFNTGMYEYDSGYISSLEKGLQH
jgi:lipoprotein-releasing system permease protein